VHGCYFRRARADVGASLAGGLLHRCSTRSAGCVDASSPLSSTVVAVRFAGFRFPPTLVLLAEVDSASPCRANQQALAAQGLPSLGDGKVDIPTLTDANTRLFKILATPER
jgi:hypothetical protein